MRDAEEDVNKICIEVKKTSDNAGRKPTCGFSLQHKTFSALNYAQDFGTTVKESLKRGQKYECQFLHVLAQKSFHLAQILNSPQKVTCPSGKLRTEFTSSIAKSTSPGLLNTTFFARWFVKSLGILHLWWHSGFIHLKNARFFFLTHRLPPLAK